MSAASVGTTDATPTSGGVVLDPSSTLSLPEAVLVHYGEKQARTGQWESATSGVKSKLVDDPLLTDAEVKKMKEYFSGLFKDTNQLMARSKEKSEQLKSVTSVSTEEHSRVVRELKEQHAEELRNV